MTKTQTLSKTIWLKNKPESRIAIHKVPGGYLAIREWNIEAVITKHQTLRELLKSLYGRNYISHYFDRYGNLHVKYSEEIHSGEYLVDYIEKEDTYELVTKIVYGKKMRPKQK